MESRSSEDASVVRGVFVRDPANALQLRQSHAHILDFIGNLILNAQQLTQRDDMVQQATVVAVFAYEAAMRDEKLPRKALPAPQRGRGTTSQQ